MKTLRQAVFGVFATLLVLLGGRAFAQPPSAPRVDGFDVEQVSALVAGTQLNFSVFGTTGATAIQPDACLLVCSRADRNSSEEARTVRRGKIGSLTMHGTE